AQGHGERRTRPSVKEVPGSVNAPPSEPAKPCQIASARLLHEPQLGLGLEGGSLRLLKFREDTGGDLGGGDRSAEEKPLHLVAIDLFEKGCLLGGLNSLDGDPHMQLASE